MSGKERRFRSHCEQKCADYNEEKNDTVEKKVSELQTKMGEDCKAEVEGFDIFKDHLTFNNENTRVMDGKQYPSVIKRSFRAGGLLWCLWERGFML